MISPAWKSWSEAPRCLAEAIAWRTVEGGAEGRSIDWKGATREPFLSLERAGWVKLEYVQRGALARVTVHFWQAPNGERRHLKIMTKEV